MKINDNLFHYFEEAGTIVTYHPNDIIYMEEDNSTSLYLVIKGRVRVYSMTSSGDEITFDILDRGRIFGESSFFQNSLRPTTVEAINDVKLISCHLDDLYPYLAMRKRISYLSANPSYAVFLDNMSGMLSLNDAEEDDGLNSYFKELINRVNGENGKNTNMWNKFNSSKSVSIKNISDKVRNRVSASIDPTAIPWLHNSSIT